MWVTVKSYPHFFCVYAEIVLLGILSREARCVISMHILCPEMNEYLHEMIKKYNLKHTMKRFLVTLLLAFGHYLVYSQAVYNKVGGVAFRVDDHQLAYKWRSFDSIFNKYGYKFSLGLDAQRIVPDTAAYNALHEVSAHGHEIMDHTAYGTTAYSWVHTLKDTSYFSGKKGVDHINANRICFKVDSVYTLTDTTEGTVNLYGNTIISNLPGEFKNIYGNPYFSNMYFPTKNMVVTWYNLQNKNVNDPDTAQFRSYWQETITLDTVMNMPYHKITGYDIKMSPDAIKLMVERSLYLYDSLQFPRPKTWIQPGGQFAQFTSAELKKYMGDMYGYTAAATYVNTSLKMYNEVDSLKQKRFADQNPDINEESNNLAPIIKAIADNSARHLHSFTLSHFLNPLGGWSGYIARVDSLLAWCRDNQIPIRTINQWASIQFDSIPNPYVNAIPEQWRDIDKDGTPDGFAPPFGTFDTTDGVARSKGLSIKRTGSGSFFAINLLGGFEKGWNRLSMYTKGKPGDSVRVAISFNEIPYSAKYYNLAANTDNWQEVSMMVYLDPRASRMSFQVNALRNASVGEIKLAGVQLRKKSEIKVKPGARFIVRADEKFPTINVNQFVIDSFYTSNQYRVSNSSATTLSVQLDTFSNILTVSKPALIWTGTDSVFIRVSNPDNTMDSGYVYFESRNPRICAGSSIVLRVDKNAGSNFKWSDPNNVFTGDTLAVSPTQTTHYYFQYVDKNNKDVYAEFNIEVDTQKPTIHFASDTIICYGKSAVFTITDAGKISWADSTGRVLTQGNTWLYANPMNSLKMNIINQIGSCTSQKSVQIQVNPTTILKKKAYTISLIKGISGTVDLGITRKDITAVLINSPYNKFTYSSGVILFDPKSNFSGKDTAVFVLSDMHCANDTIQVVVNVSNSGIIESSENVHYRIYPNPASAYVGVEIASAAELVLYDLSGRECIKTNMHAGYNRVQTEQLPTGIYLIKITVENRASFAKFVKE